jgi:hypothetical protein
MVAGASMIMADVLVAALCLLATLAYVRYMETGRARYSVRFGVYFALALLTKGSALAVALVPVVCIAATRRWSWLARASFWAPAGIVIVSYLPWHLYTRQMVENGLFFADSRLSWASSEIVRMIRMAVGLFGPALFAAFLIGAVVMVLAPVFFVVRRSILCGRLSVVWSRERSCYMSQ